MFKFPSKTYPRSSYYVTGDEIIIRIKKARKKWKLVVPKKRLVSYRTNRWFAKPRWVEIELTYTQATRLKLVEPRLVPKEAPADGPPAAATGQVEDAPPPVEIENAAGETVLELGPEVGEQDDADGPSASADVAAGETVEEAPATDDAASIAAVPEATPAVDPLAEAAAPAARDCAPVVAVEPTPTPPPFPPEPEPEPERIAFVPPAPPVPPPPRALPEPAPIASRDRRRKAKAMYGVAASLATVLVIVAASLAENWLPRGAADEQAAGRTACESLDCAHDIVTGSIAKPEERPAPEAVLPADSASAVVEMPEHLTAEIEQTRPSEDLPRAPEQTRAEPEPEHAPEPRDTAATMPDPPPVAEFVPPAPEASAAGFGCRELGDAAPVLRIRFDYASFKLTPEAQAALDGFAQRLLQCPTVVLTISGHTDSEGHADRNRRLSIRRAQAVLKHLAAAGAQPAQLSAVGLGPTQPYLPNTSAENRQQNRRAEVVVAFRP